MAAELQAAGGHIQQRQARQRRISTVRPFHLHLFRWRFTCAVLLAWTFFFQGGTTFGVFTEKHPNLAARRYEEVVDHRTRLANERIEEDFDEDWAKELVSELPWERKTTEIMIDAMSVIRAGLDAAQLHRMDILFGQDPHNLWPARAFGCGKALTKLYGKDRPPSPWKPITVVYDMPNHRRTVDGRRIRLWHSLTKQGPRSWSGVTMNWAWSYVDISASEKYRCDKEILWMLNYLKQDYPSRRQVLVTDDPVLHYEAMPYAKIRSSEWLFKELKENCGQMGIDCVETICGRSTEADKYSRNLPPQVKRAFLA